MNNVLKGRWQNKAMRNDVQSRLTLHVVDHLLNERFNSKKDLAEQLNISYRAVLRLYNGACTERDVQIIMNGIARYCMTERISPVHLFHGFYSM